MADEPLAGNTPGPGATDPATEPDAPVPTRAKVLTGLVAAVAVLAAGWLMLRISSPAIAPGQAPPQGHYGLSCGWCHSMSSDVPVGAAE